MHMETSQTNVSKNSPDMPLESGMETRYFPLVYILWNALLFRAVELNTSTLRYVLGVGV